MSDFIPPADADKFNLDDDVNAAETQQPTATTVAANSDDYNSAVTEDEEDAYSSIGHNAVQNIPQPPDDNLPRYGLSGLLPISLMKMTGNNSWADFNRKDRAGRTIINFNWYPAFTLVPIFGGSFQIPYENKPTYSDEPVQAAQFDLNKFEKDPHETFTQAVRSARECSEIFLRENRSSGCAVLHSLTGYNAGEADKGFSSARRLVETILPVRDRSVFPETTRVRAGVVFKGPFLDTLLADVKANGLKRLEAAGYSIDPQGIAYKCYQEIRKVLSDGEQRANAFVDETEAEIRKPDGLKRTYDPPDLETYDAPVSTDLYCLAHVDRVELDNKQLRASENIGREIANPMTEFVREMRDALKAQPAVPAGAIPVDQVESMIQSAVSATRDQLSKEFDEKLKAATAAKGKKD
jgi:hypothetical protein